MAKVPDPKKTYARLELWGALLVPVEIVPAFKDAIRVERDYRDGKHVYRFKGDTLSFEMVHTEDLLTDMAAQRLEE